MSADPDTNVIRYKRSRFTAKLPTDRMYTRSHYWVQRQPDGTHRVGFTRFARRMLGEIVEAEIEAETGSAVELGDVIGWVEAFKAVADVYCVGTGTLAAVNERLDHDPALIDRDPHGDGWLYAFDGEPDPGCVDAQGYTEVLDERIDQMLGEGYTGMEDAEPNA